VELKVFLRDLGFINVLILSVDFRHSREVSEFLHINQVMLAMFLFYQVTESSTIDEGDVVQGGRVGLGRSRFRWSFWCRFLDRHVEQWGRRWWFKEEWWESTGHSGKGKRR
jgi:hypothetical protein